MSLQSRVYGFIPTSITGCSLWLDGADPAGNGVVPSAGNLSTWTDKSGKLNSPTSSSGTYPTYSPTSKCVTWTGGASQLTFPNSLHQYVVGTAFTVFFVEQRTTGSENFIIRGSSQGTNLNLLIGHGGTSPTTSWRFAFYGNDLDYTGLPSYSASEPATVSCFMYSKPNRAIYHNGSVSANASDNNASDLTSWTGAMIGGNSIWPGYTGNVFEMLIYSTSLTLIQRQQVEAYLAQKYILTGYLPAGHPGLGETIYRSDFTKQNVMTARPYYTAFSPRQVGGLGLWLDGADSSTVTGTSPITAWTDKSGNGRTVTITSGPTYGTTTRNGLKTMYFNNNVISSSIASAVGTGDFTLIAVWYQSSAGTNTVLSLGTVASSSQSLGFSGNKYNFYQFGDVNESAYSASTPSWVVQIGTRIGSVKKVYINGNVGTTPSSTSYDVSVTTVTIGKGDNFAITGEIGEIMIYTGTMSDTSRQLLESYLTQKWGLTASLPGGHLNATQPAGAITLTALTNFRIFSRLRTPLFLPTSIAGLQMWMDAADSSADSMTLSGSTVTVWKDKSGLGNNSTGRSGTSTLTSSAINGKSAISMAGGYFTGPFATANTGTQVHAFAVMTIDSSTGQWARPFSLGRPGVNDYDSSTTTFAIIRYNGTQGVAIGRAGQYLNVGIPAYSSAFLVQSSHNGATEYMSVNGTLTPSSLSTGQSGNFNITSYGLGVNTNTSDYFALNGYYGEVMYFNVQLSDANRQKIEGYLAWKWGLQASLPGGHPYASAAP